MCVPVRMCAYVHVCTCVRLHFSQPEKSWQVDIEHMESLIDDKTRCIILVNPSNPCGSVYSKEHLLEIVAG